MPQTGRPPDVMVFDPEDYELALRVARSAQRMRAEDRRAPTLQPVRSDEVPTAVPWMILRPDGSPMSPEKAEEFLREVQANTPTLSA